ncbi:hypothetical protein MKW92_016922 [Papaver armeniacum]|nr:hypothetical protein MKW92_016922 [Papaver armeniacum]
MLFNVRYVFSLFPCLIEHMAKELNVILDHGEVQPAVSCSGDSGSVSYLEQVVSPIYETMVKTTKSSFVEHQTFEVFTDLFLVLTFQVCYIQLIDS